MDSRLVWLAVAAFVGGTEGGSIAGLLPLIGTEMQVSTGQAGQMVLGYALAYAIGTPLLSVVLGGVGRRRILAGAEATLALGALLIAVSPAFGWMVGARTLLALGAGLFTATALATAALLAEPGQRGRALQIVTTGQAVAVLVGVPVGAWVAAHFSWRFNYAAIAVMAAAAAVALYTKLPRGMHGDGNTQSIRDRIRVLGDPGIGPALVITLLFMSASFPPLVFVGALMRDAGIGLELLPAVLLANGIGAIGASMSAGSVADRLGNRVTLIGATLVLVAGLALVSALPHLPVGWRLPAILVAYGMQGYIGWMYWIAHCSEMARLAPNSVPVAISLDLTAMNVGIAIAAGFGGLLVDAWGINALCLAAIPVAVAGVALWLIVPAVPNSA